MKESDSNEKVERTETSILYCILWSALVDLSGYYETGVSGDIFQQSVNTYMGNRVAIIVRGTDNTEKENLNTLS